MKLSGISIFLFFIFSSTLSAQDRHQIQVTYVVDGDTFYGKDNAGTKIKFRFIGFDTPEKPRNGKSGEPFHKDATAFTYHVLHNATVYVEYDIQKLDKYGRHLVYVYLDDGILFNEIILSEGWAELMTFPPNVKYVDRFRAAYREGRENKRGMWKRSIMQQ